MPHFHALASVSLPSPPPIVQLNWLYVTYVNVRRCMPRIPFSLSHIATPHTYHRLLVCNALQCSAVLCGKRILWHSRCTITNKIYIYWLSLCVAIATCTVIICETIALFGYFSVTKWREKKIHEFGLPFIYLLSRLIALIFLKFYLYCMRHNR